jgi:uncharacterized protein involved in exopolysaccharide biosynthesis
LASLAGQFGVTLPAVNPSLSPDFYVKLLQSRVLLGAIARDTFVVREMGDRRVSFLDLFGVDSAPSAVRQERGLKILLGLVKTSAGRTTGVVESTVMTRWPSVSLAIATALADGVNDFNFRMRQTQASAERRFLESRVTVAAADLDEAEARMERFLRANRDFRNSPELTFTHDHLEREVLLRQQVLTSLTQSLEDARLREVRDTPLITIFEPASVKAIAEPRGRLQATILGFVIGGFLGTLAALFSGLLAHLRRIDNRESREFVSELGHLQAETLQAARGIWARISRGAGPGRA